MSENLPEGQPASNPVPPAAQPAPGYGAAPVQPKGLAVSSLVVGIISLVLAWPVAIVGIIGGVVALILGIIGLKKGQSRGMSLTGIITGALAIVLAIIAMIVVAMFLGAVLNDPNLQQQLQELEDLQQ